jgi:predicted choloylglycine hydrolase
MKRRDFVKTAISIPFLLKPLLSENKGSKAKYLKGNEKNFDFLEIKGSYEQIGIQIGQYFGNNIRMVIERRKDWHANLMNILRSKEGRIISEEYLNLTRKHFPHLLEEIKGMADGAGLHFDAIWTMCIKSELLAIDEESPGCSTIFYKDDNHMWLFHNEDGDAAYADQMFLLKVVPPSGVNYLSMVYPGIITGNGPSVNNRGIIQTTNFIGSRNSNIGIPRYIIGRAVLEAKNLKEAVDIITMEPRAYPYHHNLASFLDNRYISLETTPQEWEAREPQGIYYHTNHLLFDKTEKYQSEDQAYKQTSSLSRYQVIEDEIRKLQQDNLRLAEFVKILSSHRNAPYSPCRHPQGEVKGATLGMAFYDFNQGVLRLFKGNPCKAIPDSSYIDFDFNQI